MSRSRRPDASLLKDMLEAADRAMSYCRGLSFDAFLTDTKTQDAVARNMEILGEAAGRASEGLKASTAMLPWAAMSGVRNRLIHGYFGVNWDVVWSVVQDDLPALATQLRELLDRQSE